MGRVGEAQRHPPLPLILSAREPVQRSESEEAAALSAREPRPPGARRRGVENEKLTKLLKLQEEFRLEAARPLANLGGGKSKVSSSLGLQELVAEGEQAEQEEEDEEALLAGIPTRSSILGGHLEPEKFGSVQWTGSTKLAGVVFAPDGSRAAATPGYGRGVAPSTDVDHCAIVTIHPRKPPIVVTAAGDGENLLWSPCHSWDRLGVMPFYSVFTCRQETSQSVTTKGRFRQGEIIKKEREAKSVQLAMLDPAREKFISREMHTTVLMPLQFDVAEQTFAQLEQTRLLFENPAPVERGGLKSSAATGVTIPSTPKALLELLRLRGRVPRDTGKRAHWMKEEESKEAGHRPSSVPSNIGNVVPANSSGGASAGKDLNGTAGSKGVNPLMTPSSSVSCKANQLDTPVGASNRGTASTIFSKAQPFPDVHFSSTANGEGGDEGGRNQHTVPVAAHPREELHVSCLATHPTVPRVVVGIGDGQVAVYHVYRAHGQRQPQLHQTQGFDASRGVGDIASAAFMPEGRLAQDGDLNNEVMVVGFTSGRVAVFKIMLPGALPGSLQTGGGASSRRGVALASQPILTNFEPVLLEHRYCHSQVQRLLWHNVLGILSVHRNGTVLVVDTTGTVTCSISNACGRDVFVSSVDLSLEHEQLALAGQRGVHLWQCFSQTKMGVLDTVANCVKKSTTMTLAVHYLPSQRLLLTAHELHGEVKLWDVLRLEPVTSVTTPECPRASCVSWDPLGMTLLVFGPMGVATFQVHEDDDEEAVMQADLQSEVQDEEAVELAKELTTGRWEVRRNAAEELGTLGKRAFRQAVALEKASREDDDADVRETARVALTRMAELIGKSEQQLLVEATQANERVPVHILRKRWDRAHSMISTTTGRRSATHRQTAMSAVSSANNQNQHSSGGPSTAMTPVPSGARGGGVGGPSGGYHSVVSSPAAVTRRESPRKSVSFHTSHA